MAGVIGFPNPVNEKAARVVAGGVALLGIITVLTGWLWILPVLALGFLARVLTGPRLSLLGQLATKAVAPRLGEPRLVPGPPKRFAQGIGLGLTTVASLVWLGLGWSTVAWSLAVVLVVFALLESVAGFCAGCWLFAQLMRAGLIPESTCEACNNLTLRSA